MKPDPMTTNVPTTPPNITKRIAAHLIDFPLKQQCDTNHEAEQLLNDVLQTLRSSYIGAYAGFVPPPSTVTQPAIIE